MRPCSKIFQLRMLLRFYLAPEFENKKIYVFSDLHFITNVYHCQIALLLSFSIRVIGFSLLQNWALDFQYVTYLSVILKPSWNHGADIYLLKSFTVTKELLIVFITKHAFSFSVIKHPKAFWPINISNVNSHLSFRDRRCS